jgi:glutamyl-tRNA synthetase
MSHVRKTPPRGRYAPTPSGEIHLGNARTALLAWLSIRKQGGVFVWRVEDLDPPRLLEGAIESAMTDLRWLGIDWDEGPDAGGDYGPYQQSERSDSYETALRKLSDASLLFPCALSRREVDNIATAPHSESGETPYPQELRPRHIESGWYSHDLEAVNGAHTIRFCVSPGEVDFEDIVLGRVAQDVGKETGDFILKRRDGLYAYQLAVVVDDIAMDISEVVRGKDILSSTGRQILLTRALGGSTPRYAHVPLVLNQEGLKLSKRDDALTLQSLRAARVRPQAVVGYLAWSAGLATRPEAISPRDLVNDFSWDKLARDDHRLPDNIIDQLLEL